MRSSAGSHARVLRRAVAVTVLLLAAAIGMAGPTDAGTLTFNGTIAPGGPTMPVVFISTPNCTGQGTTPVGYEVIEYTPIVDGDVSFSLTTDGASTSTASIYVMEQGFDPAAAFPFCLAASNSGDPATTLTYNMTGGTTYELVVFDDSFAQLGFNWELVMQTPPAVDMGIEITAGGPYAPGATARFEVAVTDIETDDAVNSEVVVTLPEQFDPDTIGNVTVGGIPAYDCTVDAGAGTLTCTTALHPVGETATIAFDATLVTTGLTQGQEIEVDAEVTVESPPTVNPEDDTATAVVVINIPTTTTVAPIAPAAPAAAVAVTPAFTG